MSSRQPGPVAKAWGLWKSLRLPWRKRFFVGQDPQGNTYYELRHQPRGDAAPETAPYRRLVHYPRSTPYSEVRVPPAWHQWLRHQREFPPSMEEQVAELQRQARIKVLAAEADARWRAKPSLLDMPETTTKKEAVVAPGDGQVRAARESGAQLETPPQRQTQGGGGGEGRRPGKEEEQTGTPSPDPWKRAERGAPGETWQPEAWTPTPARKR
ncbi:hypothetical protein F5Y14DRAFT_156550 [Nemania sp. NC0429]|nr:hypothetical protein F5Y14DRAFT_156550 [Nemania sp. NC0429]